jgi:hypothetical protein
MRPMKYAALSLLLFSASLLLATRSKAQSSVDESAGPQGTGARTSADQYHSHAQRDGVSVGAEILTPKRVEKSFASDVNRCCIVVEFALYPKKGETLDLWLNDFELYVAGGDIPMKPVSASAVAGWVQNKNSDGTPVSATVDVEYENPPSKVHGSYSTTDAGADVSPNTDEHGRGIRRKGIARRKSGRSGCRVLVFSHSQTRQKRKVSVGIHAARRKAGSGTSLTRAAPSNSGDRIKGYIRREYLGSRFLVSSSTAR